MGAMKKSSAKKQHESIKKRQQQNEESLDEHEQVDYAATADMLASDAEEDSASEDFQERIGGESDDESPEKENSDDESVEEQEDMNVSDDDDDTDNDEGENSDEEMDDDDRETSRPINNDIRVPGDEPCTFDLRNLLGVSSHPIDSSSLYDPRKKNADVSATIPLCYAVNEDYLLKKAEAGCNQIISALWQLPIVRSDAGPMVQLPSFDDSKIPRALPPPPPKAETKWEKFAKEKGIGQNKEKRSAKVFDETTGDWQYRHGFKKAGADKEWPIMEVKTGDDPFADPWEKQREAKRSRVDKNAEQRIRNEERAGGLAKGTSSRMMKSIAASRKAGKEGGRDLPVGVPVDLKPTGKKGNSDVKPHSESRQRGKTSTMAALLATQRSTASLGKFDKMREGEPEYKKALATAKKRKFESATDAKVISTEAERSLKLLKTLSGGAAKEKDRKKGRLATGESGYDYDFDDGLGASTFRKKKGRAAAGKMKKMTKKRAK